MKKAGVIGGGAWGTALGGSEIPAARRSAPASAIIAALSVQ